MEICGPSQENALDVSLKGRRMEEIKAYRYLGVDASSGEKMSEEANLRMGNARRTVGALMNLRKKRLASREASIGRYEETDEPTLL